MGNGKQPWWRTKIIQSDKNKLMMRGYRVEELIGNISYGELVFLLIMGELPSRVKGKLLEATLVAGADHGVPAPSVAVSRIAATCGIPLNCCVATGINLLGDIHGGAAEQLMKILYKLNEKARGKKALRETLVREACEEFKEKKQFVPGFGHPLHDDDPRVRRLFDLVEEARQQGEVEGEYVEMVKTMERILKGLYPRQLPINIDGACAAVQCELGLPWQSAKGLFCLSRGVGLVAESLEEFLQGSRLKSPMPMQLWGEELLYEGPEERSLPEQFKKKD